MDYENYDQFLEDVIGRIREERKARNMTQAELSEMIGRSDKYINKIESSKKGLSLQALFEIGKVLDLPVNSFLIADKKDYNSRIKALSDEDRKAVMYLLDRFGGRR